MKILAGILEAFKKLLPALIALLSKKKAEQPVPQPEPEPDKPAKNPWPKIHPDKLRIMLKEEALLTGPFNWSFLSKGILWEDFDEEYGYTPVEDDPETAEIETQTYCNFFTRRGATWYGWKGFNMTDRDQAGEITRYMRSHPEQWMKLEGTFEYIDRYTKEKSFKNGPDYNRARDLACKGHLVIAGRENPLAGQPGQSTGHVCVIAPESPMPFSTKWGINVPLAANVGGSNWYGKGLSWAFGGKEEPELFSYLGV